MDTRQCWNDDEPLPEGFWNDGPDNNPLNLAILAIPPLRRYEEEPPVTEEVLPFDAQALIRYIDALRSQIQAMREDPLWVTTGAMIQRVLQLHAHARRYQRWQSIRKRQRRAAQRRHHKGNAARRK